MTPSIETTADERLRRVRRALHGHDPTLEPVVFDRPLETSQAAAEALGATLGQVAKSILFRSGERYGLFVAPGDVRIRERDVKAHLGPKPTMARPDEVIEQTGYPVGAVCPFALRQPIPVFVDASLGRHARIFTAAGISEGLVPLTFDALVAMTHATVYGTEGGS